MADGGVGGRRHGVRTALVLVGVVVLVLGASAALTRLTDFSGRCFGGTRATEGVFDPVDLDGVVTDPLHVAVRVPLDAPTPTPGDQVTVTTDVLTPPGITAIVTAVGTSDGAALPTTVSVWPRDHLSETFVPGAAARVTLRTNGIGKTETISLDSFRPGPSHVPGRATLWERGPGPGDALLGGRAHPVPVLVTRVARGQAAITALPETPELTLEFGGSNPIVVPDHHCRTHRFWPPVQLRAHQWNATSDTVELAP